MARASCAPDAAQSRRRNLHSLLLFGRPLHQHAGGREHPHHLLVLRRADVHRDGGRAGQRAASRRRDAALRQRRVRRHADAPQQPAARRCRVPAWNADTLPVGARSARSTTRTGTSRKSASGASADFEVPSSEHGSFIITRWLSTATGVTEAGSSGSGIFTAIGQPASVYQFRGGLLGGPSSCTASPSELLDYYSASSVYPYLRYTSTLAPRALFLRLKLKRPLALAHTYTTGCSVCDQHRKLDLRVGHRQR